MPKYSPLYPVNDRVRDALHRYPNLAAHVGTIQKSRDSRHIVRLLDNTHYPGIDRFLAFLDRLPADWGKAIRELTSQISESQFRQRLAELRLAAYMCGFTPDVSQPSIPRDVSQYDLDVVAANIVTKIEVYSPFDFSGIQIFNDALVQLFKHLDVEIGFDVELDLSPTEIGHFSYQNEIGSAQEVEGWLGDIQQLASGWLRSQPSPGSAIQFSHPKGVATLTARLLATFEDAQIRQVQYLHGTSLDSRVLFDHGEPSSVAYSKWGRNLRKKVAARQCGDPSEQHLRLLVISFAELYTSFPNLFRTNEFGLYDRISAAVTLIATLVGTPLAYDAIILARISPLAFSSGPDFAPPIILDPALETKVRLFASAAGIAGKLVPRA